MCRFAAAAGTAWYGRQKIVDTAQNSQLWVTSHLEFVGVLWKSSELRDRLEELLELQSTHVQFFWWVVLIGQALEKLTNLNSVM